MTSKVFISGITGFVGSVLSQRLSSLGMQVTGLTRQPQVSGCITGDISQCAELKEEVASADIVIHLAAPTTAAEINGDPLGAMRTNLIGTHNMLEAFASGSGSHFVYFSSGKVYGRQRLLPFNETMTVQPNTPLGQSKRAAEQLVEFYAQHTGRCFSIVRLFNAYGPGQRTGFVIPTILEQLHEKEIKLGDTRGRRDFIYIADVVDAVERLIRERDSGCEIYNVGSAVSYCPADIIEMLEELTGREIRVAVDPARLRKGEPDEERADIEKMQTLGWAPQINMKDGLKRILEAVHVTAR